MKLKLLLLGLLFMGGLASAQDTIDYLVITEARIDNTHAAYLELTNMGDQPVQLSDFKIGSWGGGSTLINAQSNENDYWIPVDTLLQPGESFLFASWDEYGPRKFAQGDNERFPERQQQQNILEEADFLVDLSEGFDDGTDMVTPGLEDPFSEQWGPGMNGFYIEYHLPNGDSAVVDQVCGMFTGDNGQNLDRTNGEGYDVAGVEKATGNSYLIRRASVKKGNLDFAGARGIGLEDSEWIPIPIHGGSWRLAPWTIGNQGDYNLDASTLESDEITVDFDNKILTVPWGVRRGDDIMSYFTKKPGIGWEYVVGPTSVEDSLSFAAKTGDQLIIYVCGNDLDIATFDIVVAEPLADANIVVPVSNKDPNGDWRDDIENGILGWPRVTQLESGMDTIWGIRGGIPYATRVDSLMERLEKPSNAEWDIVYAGDEKPDLSNGDMLKVTASDGSEKDYFISVLPFRPSHDATLSSITWPDIPEFYKGLFGWVGDTIPNFGSEILQYNIQVPLLAEGIPAFVGKANHPNAKVAVKRAKSLSGSDADRTAEFNVTAEDDTTVYNYKLALSKEGSPDDLQPYYAEPILSEVEFNQWWSNNDFLEIYNPGNQQLDLSNYMIVGYGTSLPPEAISITNETSWLDRYDKYIPGYKWQDEANWAVEQYIAEPDLSVNKIVEPGDVFVMGSIKSNDDLCNESWLWPGFSQVDVQFRSTSEFSCRVILNQWNEELSNDGSPFSKWHTAHIYLFKILNDSIQRGLKPAIDPNDFELVDVIGMPGDDLWVIEGQGIGNPAALIRKPEITEGNPLVGASMGNDTISAEWNVWNLDFWANAGYGWPWRMRNITSDLGKHYAQPATRYKSTVGSVIYKLTPGYSMEEDMWGIVSGTTVSEFFDNVIKADTGQTLVVTTTADGSELGLDAAISNSDTLTVISADGVNTSKYILEVSDEGLSSDALLTSTAYTVNVSVEPDGSNFGVGTVEGMPYGTTVKTVKQNVSVPTGARMEIIDDMGAYVPLKVLGYDTTYMDVTVSTEVYFEVLAEDGKTGILYQLLPESDMDVFLTSDIFAVDQDQLIVSNIPAGMGTQSFLSRLVASPGATIKVLDKSGFERVDGLIYEDDKVVVTSADGETSVVYFISVLSLKVTYFAFITSETYLVDQVGLLVNGVYENTSISDFQANIEGASGAAVIVLDENGNEKSSGVVEASDMVQVTSGDESIVVLYSIGELLVKVELSNAQNIQLYPNPSSGVINVTGLIDGQRIQVYNSLGGLVADRQVVSDHDIISIDDQPSGLYMMIIGDKDDQIIGKFKVIKR